MKQKSKLRILFLASSSLLAITYSHAATLTWDGDTGTGDAQDVTGTFPWAPGDLNFWNGSANVATTNDIATDIAQFGNGGTLASSPAINAGTQSIGGLIFGATTTSGYTLTAGSTGQVLSIGGSGITLNSGAQATTVGSGNLGVTLGAAQTWTNNSASTLTIAGKLTAASALTLKSGNFALTGTNSVLTGGVTISDGARLILGTGYGNGANTYNIVLGESTGNTSGVLQMGDASGTKNLSFESITTSGSGAGNAIVGGNATASSLTITSSSATPVTYAGKMGGIGTNENNLNFIKGGTVTVMLTGASTCTGYTRVNNGTLILSGGDNRLSASTELQLGVSGGGSTSGTLQLGDATAAVNQTVAGLRITDLNTGTLHAVVGGNASVSTLTVNNSADYSFAGKLGGTGTNENNLALTKSGAGALTLTRANTFSGTTTVSGGLLTLSNALALQNSVLDSTNSTASSSVTTGLKTTVTTLTLGGLKGNKDLASLFDPSNGYNGLTALTLDTVTGATPSYSGIIGNGAMTLTKSGAGTQTFTGANTYTGNTTISAGTLNLGVAETAGTSGPLGNQSATAAGTILMTGGTLQYSASNNFDYSGRFSTAGSQTWNIDTNGRTVTYATALQGTGSKLTKSGSGTLILQSANSYTGTTTVNGGTLRLQNTSALGGLGNVNVNDATLSFSTDSPTWTIGRVLADSTAASATLSSNRATAGAGLTHVIGDLNLVSTGGQVNVTAGGNVTSGTAAIQMTSASIQGSAGVSAGFNPTTADVIIGTVNMSTSNAGTATLTLGGTSSGNQITGNIVKGARVTANVTKSGTSTWTLSGTASDYNGTTSVRGGTLRVNGTQTLATGAVTVGGANASGTPTLEGIGTLGGNVTIETAGGGAAGTLAPGSGGIGNLVLNSTTLTFGSGSTGSFEVDADTVSNRDRVTGISTLTYGGKLKITATGTLSAGDSWDLFDFTSQSGAFDNNSSFGTNGSSDPDLPDLGAGLTWAFDYATGTLSVASSGGSAYSTWAAAKGLTGVNNAKSDDPDNDGKNNLHEFAFNGNPLDPSDNGMVAGLVQDASAPVGKELTLIVAVRNGASFSGSGSPAVQSATADGVTYTIQGTLDLANIPGSAVSHVSGPSNTAPVATGLTVDLSSADWKYHTFKLDASEGLTGKGFLRAKASE